MKTLLKIAAALLAVLVAVVLALPFLVDANVFRPRLEQEISNALGRGVTIGDLRLALLSGGVSARDLRVAEDPAFGTEPFVSAAALDVGVDLPALLFSRALHATTLTIDGAKMVLIQTPSGDWNFSSLGAPGAEPAPAEAGLVPAQAEAPLDFSVRLIRFTNGTLDLASGAARRQFRDVNLEVRDLSRTAAVPFTLSANVTGGGALQVSGTVGPLVEAHAEQTPLDAKAEIKTLNLAASGFASPASGIGGLLSFNGQVNSNGKTAALTGAVTVDDLKLSTKDPAATRPVGINLALAHDLNSRRGNIARSTLKLGSASATIAGDYDLSQEAPRLNLRLQGSEMPLQELLAFLPAAGVVLPSGATLQGGTLSLDLTARGSTEKLTTVGSVQMQNARLANYDLGAKLGAIQQLAGLPATAETEIQRVAVRFENSSAGTRVPSVELVAPALGSLTGEGTVSPERALDFRMKAVVKTGGLLAAAIQQRGETTTVPFFIQGTASDPVFKADVKSIAGEKLQQVIANPEGAAKNVREIVETGKGILNMFKKAPPKQPEQK